MFTDIQRQQLAEGAALWGIALNSGALDRFALFADRMEEANRHFNLTRIAPEDIVPLHFLDSLALAAMPEGACELNRLPQKTEAESTTPASPNAAGPGNRTRAALRLLDVGTGAGFPGMPLAIAFPELDITLLDGTRKRLHFLDEVIAALGLPNVRTLHGRAEEIARQAPHRAGYDLVTSRAVAKLSVLAGWLLPLTKPGGLAVAYKSLDTDAEIAEAVPTIRTVGGILESTHTVTLPFVGIARRLIGLRKQVSAVPPAPSPRQRTPR